MAVFVTPKRIYWFHLIRYGQKKILNTNYGKFTPENNMEIQIFRNNSNQHQTSQTNSKFEVSLDRLISILASSLIQLLPFRIAPASTKWNDEKKTQLYCVNTSRWNAVLTGAVPNNFLLFRCVIFLAQRILLLLLLSILFSQSTVKYIEWGKGTKKFVLRYV